MTATYDPKRAEDEIREAALRLGCMIVTEEFTCQICREKMPIAARFWNTTPGINCHCQGSCIPCVNRGVEINLADGGSPIDPYKKKPLADHVLSWLLTQHDFKIDFSEIRARQTAKFLEKKMVPCPNCHVQSAGEYECPNVECPHCDAKFCLDCHQLRDEGDHDCPIRKWITAAAKSERYYAIEGAPKETWLFGDKVPEDKRSSSYYQSGKVCRCPDCGTLCQKMSGCDSVICPMKECRKSFAWSAIKAL